MFKSATAAAAAIGLGAFTMWAIHHNVGPWFDAENRRKILRFKFDKLLKRLPAPRETIEGPEKEPIFAILEDQVTRELNDQIKQGSTNPKTDIETYKNYKALGLLNDSFTRVEKKEMSMNACEVLGERFQAMGWDFQCKVEEGKKAATLSLSPTTNPERFVPRPRGYSYPKVYYLSKLNAKIYTTFDDCKVRDLLKEYGFEVRVAGDGKNIKVVGENYRKGIKISEPLPPPQKEKVSDEPLPPPRVLEGDNIRRGACTWTRTCQDI